MSATLGTLLSELQPDWKIVVYERLHDVGMESSNAWNNAGTGHAALCELNYTPAAPTVPSTRPRPIQINEQFQQSPAVLVVPRRHGRSTRRRHFINPIPHMTFVHGEKDVAFLKTRYEALKKDPLFAEHPVQRRPPGPSTEWVPLLMQKPRAAEPFAATRVPAGTDVDFGALTRQLLDSLRDRGAEIVTNREVRTTSRSRATDVADQGRNTIGTTPGESSPSRRVRVRRRRRRGAAAAAALGDPRDQGLRRLPDRRAVLRSTTNPALVAKHKAKVYGQAAVGAPPMSVPHLDTRGCRRPDSRCCSGRYADVHAPSSSSTGPAGPVALGAPGQHRLDARGRRRPDPRSPATWSARCCSTTRTVEAWRSSCPPPRTTTGRCSTPVSACRS